MNREFEARMLKAINDLHSTTQQQLNRLLACEAMMVAMLHCTAPQALAGLAEEYSAAIDRIAAELPPGLQRPEEWRHIADVLEELQKFHAHRGNNQTSPSN